MEGVIEQVLPPRMSTLQVAAASPSKSSDAGAALRRAAEEAIAAGSAKWAKKAREEAERTAVVMGGGPPRMSKALIITDKFGNPIDFTKSKSTSASSPAALPNITVATAAVDGVSGAVVPSKDCSDGAVESAFTKQSLCQLATPSSKFAEEAIATGSLEKARDKAERTEYNSIGWPLEHAALSRRIDTKIKEEEARTDAVLDDKLTALLRMWDLEDAGELLAEHGWKSMSRLKHFKLDKHMDKLGLPSGTVCVLQAMLQSIPDMDVKLSDTIDDELTALLRMWDLEDAAEALAEHGWKSMLRLKHFKHDKHMDKLGLSSGTESVLEAMLKSIPLDVFVNMSDETLNGDVMPPDTHNSAISSRLNDFDKAFVGIKTYRDTLQYNQDLLELNEARSEEAELVEEKIKSKIMSGNQKVALTVQKTDIEKNLSSELLETKRNLKKKIDDLKNELSKLEQEANNDGGIDYNHDYDAYAVILHR